MKKASPNQQTSTTDDNSTCRSSVKGAGTSMDTSISSSLSRSMSDLVLDDENRILDGAVTCDENKINNTSSATIPSDKSTKINNTSSDKNATISSGTRTKIDNTSSDKKATISSGRCTKINNTPSDKKATISSGKSTNISSIKNTSTSSKPNTEAVGSTIPQWWCPGSLGEQFQVVTETEWFKSSVSYLRKNVVRMAANSAGRYGSQGQGPRTRSNESRVGSPYPCGSYFEKLKARKQMRISSSEKTTAEVSAEARDSIQEGNDKVGNAVTEQNITSEIFREKDKNASSELMLNTVGHTMEAFGTIQKSTAKKDTGERSTTEMSAVNTAKKRGSCVESRPQGDGTREQSTCEKSTDWILQPEDCKTQVSSPCQTDTEEDLDPEISYFNKLKARPPLKTHPQDDVTNTSFDVQPFPTTEQASCWFCSTIPGPEPEDLEPIPIEEVHTRRRKSRSKSTSRRSSVKSKQTTQQTRDGTDLSSAIPMEEVHARRRKRRSKSTSKGSSGQEPEVLEDIPMEKVQARRRKRRSKSTSKGSSVKSKQTTQQTQDTTDLAEDIPNATILNYHDYEYERFKKKGCKSLKEFKRQAARCFAENYLKQGKTAAAGSKTSGNFDKNTNADDSSKIKMPESHSRFESSTDSHAAGLSQASEASDALGDSVDTVKSAAVLTHGEKSTPVSKSNSKDKSTPAKVGQVKTKTRAKTCLVCMKTTSQRLLATVLCVCCCQCPKKTNVPWWTIYLTWTLAMVTAIGSSWVVMLYGLRLGYQGSVDWLSAFFTGFVQNAFVLAPLKVLGMSLLYIMVLEQHVNFRDEAGVAVRDERQELLHKKMLREYEARRVLLDGMWTVMDYEYPIPRSKAKDIKLRLEQDARARMILRESVIWVVFLIAVAVTCWGHTSVEDAHQTNNVVRNMLEEGAYGEIALEEVQETDHVWTYLMDTMLPSLYATTNKTTASGVSIILSKIRLRQVRQRPGNDYCKPVVELQVQRYLSKEFCLPVFGNAETETRSYNHSWSQTIDRDLADDAWRFRSSLELKEPITWGRTATYPGGGYAVDLPNNVTRAMETLDTLERQEWIDMYTRAVLVDLNLYTPSKDLISSVTVLVERQPEGIMTTSFFIHTVKLYYYSHDSENLVTLAETAWLVMVLVNMYYEMTELVLVGANEYLKSPWTVLELVNFLLSLSAIGLHLTRVVIVDIFLDELIEANFNAYVNFAIPRVIDQTLEILKSLVFGLVILKVFRILRFNRYFKILLMTFSIARQSIVNQVIISFILFMAFGSMCFVLYVSQLEDYSSMVSTVLALFNFCLGNSDFFDFARTQPVLGPIIFFLFFLMVAVIAVGFFVTFILESFNVAKVFVQLNADEQHVTRYIQRMVLLLIGATPKIKQVRRQRRTHPFKPASFVSDQL